MLHQRETSNFVFKTLTWDEKRLQPFGLNLGARCEKSGVERSNPGVERNNLESGAQQPVDPHGFSARSGGRIIGGR